MGLPLRLELMEDANSDNSSKLEPTAAATHGGAAGSVSHGAAGAVSHGGSPGTGARGGFAGADSSQNAQSIFEYGNFRPDLPNSTPLASAGATPTRAWLLGSRLYSFTRDDVEQPAVRLEESGYAVLGYVMNAPNSSGVSSLLAESEARQYSSQLYERDVVEVVTEAGNHVRCYVYHRPDVDRANPIPTGDWRNRLTNRN